MRKISCIILSLMLLVTAFVGCNRSKGDALTIRICGYSDSISEISHELEFKDWSEDWYEDPKAKKEVTLTVDGENVTGVYVESEKRLSEFYVTHSYTDETQYSADG